MSRLKRIVIFGGTTEGRVLSERLTEAGVSHVVCVATEYGRQVLTSQGAGLTEEDTPLPAASHRLSEAEENSVPLAEVREGRMDEAEMTAFLRDCAKQVLDATHPYADQATRTIRAACEAAGVPCLRICRKTETVPFDSNVIFFDNIDALGRALSESTGNILLTTGSKDIRKLAEDPGVRSRLFVRIIPSAESLSICGQAGVAGRQIIAMQGPFSEQMNEALIREYDISVLVTKQSGRIGGYEEKLAAAKRCGISVYVLGRPASPGETSRHAGASGPDAAGTERSPAAIPSPTATVSEALRILGVNYSMCVTLAGMGPGDAGFVSPAAREAVKAADVVLGSRRMLETAREARGVCAYLPGDVLPVLEERCPGHAVILFSGDVGVYSGAKRMREALLRWSEERGVKLTLAEIPGISASAYLASRLGVSCERAHFVSLHASGAEDTALDRAVRCVLSHEMVFVFCRKGEDLTQLSILLTERGAGRVRIAVGSRLSYPEERVVEMTAEELADAGSVTEETLCIGLIRNGEPQ